MNLAADASAVVAEALRGRGRRLIAHADLELYIAVPMWSEVVHEIGRRIDAMGQFLCTSAHVTSISRRR